MLYGGIYGYPGDAKNKNGKLRLLYECAPMSFIAEQAGGAGSTGKERVLDIKPTEVHQRVPLFVGEWLGRAACQADSACCGSRTRHLQPAARAGPVYSPGQLG